MSVSSVLQNNAVVILSHPSTVGKVLFLGICVVCL